MKKDKIYLTAQEAAEALGIQVPTLYAYVSRKLVRSETLDAGKRTRRYLAEDVKKLLEKKEQRKNPDKAVTEALHWGAPIMESRLTLIQEGQLFYRGYNALTLAQHYSVEQVAALIWQGTLFQSSPPLFDKTQGRVPASCLTLQAQFPDLSPIELFQTLLPLAALEDRAGYNLQPAAVAQTGAHILRLLAGLAARTPTAEGGVAETLQQSWAPQQPPALLLLKAALILCADHELNVSSFTARCVASARANPYQVVIAGLSALQGALHGRESERFEIFLREVERPENAHQAVADRLRRDERIPGCVQPLYPLGDPRGRMLIALVEQHFPNTSVVPLIQAIGAAVGELNGEYLTLDAGLVAVAHALSLPRDGAITLFALGRTIGWIGQAIETYETHRLIRPRATYVGELPREVPIGD